MYLFWVIWSMYSSDRIKTVIRMFKYYNKNIVFRDSQMHFYICIWEERRSFRLFSVILLKFLLKINRYWTTFERECKERQLCMDYWYYSCSLTSMFAFVLSSYGRKPECLEETGVPWGNQYSNTRWVIITFLCLYWRYWFQWRLLSSVCSTG